MTPKKASRLARPCGIFVYCTEDEKAAIWKAAKQNRQGLSQFCMTAIMAYVEPPGKNVKSTK